MPETTVVSPLHIRERITAAAKSLAREDLPPTEIREAVNAFKGNVEQHMRQEGNLDGLAGALGFKREETYPLFDIPGGMKATYFCALPVFVVLKGLNVMGVGVRTPDYEEGGQKVNHVWYDAPNRSFRTSYSERFPQPKPAPARE